MPKSSPIASFLPFQSSSAKQDNRLPDDVMRLVAQRLPVDDYCRLRTVSKGLRSICNERSVALHHAERTCASNDPLGRHPAVLPTLARRAAAYGAHGRAEPRVERMPCPGQGYDDILYRQPFLSNDALYFCRPTTTDRYDIVSATTGDKVALFSPDSTGHCTRIFSLQGGWLALVETNSHQGAQPRGKVALYKDSKDRTRGAYDQSVRFSIDGSMKTSLPFNHRIKPFFSSDASVLVIPKSASLEVYGAGEPFMQKSVCMLEPRHEVIDAALSPDGQWLAVESRAPNNTKKYSIFKTSDAQLVAQKAKALWVRLPSNEQQQMTFSAGGKYLAMLEDGRICVYDWAKDINQPMATHATDPAMTDHSIAFAPTCDTLMYHAYRAGQGRISLLQFDHEVPGSLQACQNIDFGHGDGNHSLERNPIWSAQSKKIIRPLNMQGDSSALQISFDAPTSPAVEGKSKYSKLLDSVIEHFAYFEKRQQSTFEKACRAIGERMISVYSVLASWGIRSRHQLGMVTSYLRTLVRRLSPSRPKALGDQG